MTVPAGDPATVLTALSEVTEYAVPAAGKVVRMLLAVALRFDEGVLLVEALPEYDECDMRLSAEPHLRHEDADALWSDVSDAEPWRRFIAGYSPWRWRLTNQNGYTDGAQVHLMSSGGQSEVEVQWMVEASTLRASLLAPLQSRGCVAFPTQLPADE